MKPHLIVREQLSLDKHSQVDLLPIPSLSNTTSSISRNSEQLEVVKRMNFKRYEILFDWIGGIKDGVLYSCQTYFVVTDKDMYPDYYTRDITHFTSNSQRENIINHLIRTHL